jgi:uncharacterized Tic20 family protein
VKRRRSGPPLVVTLALVALCALALTLLTPSSGRHAAAADRAGAGSAPAKRPGRPRKGAEAGTPVPTPVTTAPAGASASAVATAASPGVTVAAEHVDAKAIPQGKGLPVLVNVGVFFLELTAFDDNKGEFECTTDLRLGWTDLRLRFPPGESIHGYNEYRGKEAEERLAAMWSPTVEVTNRVAPPAYVGRRLRIYADGRVETMARTTARYKAKIDPERFPFDRQYLTLDIITREQTDDEVELTFEKADVEFSRVARTASLDGWSLGLVDLRDEEVAGWNGDRYSRVIASLFVDRVATGSLAPIFIPLIASLLIPLLAVWMNRATEEGFEVPAFELANMGIGGLFSVIALSFAIYSAYGVVAGNDNTVTRLFGLNYASLAIALGVVVLLFRFNVLTRLFGRYVNEEAFRFLSWALPVLSLGTSIAFLLIAAV